MDRSVCSTALAHSFTYLKCTCWLQQGFRGLPVLDYTARSSSELSEEAYNTGADHMIWDLSGYFAQQKYCDLKCWNPKQVHLLLWVGLFHSGLIHWPSFHHRLKLDLVYDTVSLIEGFIQAGEKVKLFWVNKPRTDSVPVLVCCLWSDMCDHIIWPVFTPGT